MSTQPDWSKAPDDATHYMPGGTVWKEGFWKKDEGNYFYSNGEWKFSHADPFRTDRLVARPSEWSGDGLPPVGIDIEVMHGTYGWIGARVVGRDGEAAIVRTNDGYAGVYPHEFRAIRTQEQIAAEEALAEIEALYIEGGPAAVYDAGYRRQVAP